MTKLYILALTLLASLPLQGMDVGAFKKNQQEQFQRIENALANVEALGCGAKSNVSHAEAPNFLEVFFKASEDLLKEDPLLLEHHPLYNDVNTKKSFSVSLKSGPTLQNITDILLAKHRLELSQPHNTGYPSLKIFNNAETFMRALDIFKRKYQEKTGKNLTISISYSLKHTPLDIFCREYVTQYPEIMTLNALDRQKFIRLLSVFLIGNDIVEVILNFTITVSESDSHSASRSFKPIGLNLDSQQKGSNDISLGQKHLDKQIQNLNGSELAMPYIKDADGEAQFKALQSVLGRKEINIVDIGGGRGETNALIKAIQDSGSTVRLLNIEPYHPFAQPYIEAHRAIGVSDVHVWQQSAQQCSASEVIKHFNTKKVDVLFASHSLYFILADMHKFAQQYAQGSPLSLEQHPLWKYFEMIDENGVFLITLQSGAGARLYRNALLGKHGLDYVPSATEDEVVPLLSSFGNMATFLRHFDLFIKQYQKLTGKKISIKMHYAVSNVPLGNFEIKSTSAPGGYTLHTPDGDFLASKMFDFYGNWNELQKLSELTVEQLQNLNPEEQKKIGIENAMREAIVSKQQSAKQMQETFLHILRVFAPGYKNMQHPNITLEISVH